MLPVDRKKRHKFCNKTQNFRHFLRQLKQALAKHKEGIFLNIRTDFSEINELLFRLVELSKVFQSFDRDWSKYKHTSNFADIYSLDNKIKIPLEKIYSEGKGHAMGISELIQFNNPSDYSTLKSFIDCYRDSWIFDFTYLNKIIEDGKTALPKQNICQSPIDEMIKLFEKQLEYIEIIKQIFKELERRKIYKMDIKLSTNPLPGIGQNMTQLNIFLCHSSGDKENVRRLHKFLISKGFNPWIDEDNLLAGQNWKLEIQRAVKKSDVVAVCLSPESIEKMAM